MYADDYLLVSIDYSKGTVFFDDLSYTTVKYNNKGYITYMKGEYKENGDGSTYSGKMEVSLNYNSEGRMTSYTTKSEGTYKIGNVTMKELGSNTTTFTWVDGKLTKYYSKADWEDTEYGGENSIWTGTFTYGNQENKFCQYPGGIIEEDGAYPFFTGLFGIGPTYLPVTEHSVEIIKYEGDHTDEYVHDYIASYTLNDDGSISTETWENANDGYTKHAFSYTYTPTSSYVAGKALRAPADAKPSPRSLLKYFMPKRMKSLHRKAVAE